MQKKQTAMQELINWMKTEEFKDALSGIEKATELLETEKQQIIDAYCDGWVMDSPDAEQYFNQTFNK